MPHMSPLVVAQLDSLCTEIEGMRRSGGSMGQKPHKLLMLLAVVHLADEGGLQENKIYFDGVLQRYFEDQYRTYAEKDDW